MDLKDVGQRIFTRHWLLILVFTLIGLAVPVAAMKVMGTDYTATARVDLGPDAHGGQDSTSLGDTGLGLATSPQILNNALKEAKVSRDLVALTANVTVTPVGTSGVLDVAVVDTDARAAAVIANSLAKQIVDIRDQSEFGSARQLLAQLQQRDAQLSQQIGAVVAEVQKYTFTAPPGLQAQQSDLQAQRQAVYAQEQQLAQNLATLPKPHVIDASMKDGVAAPSTLTVLLPLGGLLGLIVGIAIAAIREATSPTLNRDALARHLGAPLLGRISHRDHAVDPWLAGYVRSAADAAGVGTVQLVGVGRHPVDVTSLAAALDVAVPGIRVVALQLPGGRHSAGAAAQPVGPDTGIVVVAPGSVKSKRLAALERHLQVTRQVVIGIIGHRGTPAIVPDVREPETEQPFVPNVVRDTEVPAARASH